LKPSEVPAIDNRIATTQIVALPNRSGHVNSATKRVFDVLVSLLGLLSTLAILLFVAILIKTTSKGPVFYGQTRLGRSGKAFTVIKFRSMYQDSENGTGAVWASKFDPRITPIGKILRLTYIDELPQFWNVLKSDMSIVGPRPERPELIPMITERIPEFDSRLACKPGITGLAQINYGYGNTMKDARNKLRYDLIYISSATAFMDLKIVLKTISRSLSRHGT